MFGCYFNVILRCFNAVSILFYTIFTLFLYFGGKNGESSILYEDLTDKNNISYQFWNSRGNALLCDSHGHLNACLNALAIHIKINCTIKNKERKKQKRKGKRRKKEIKEKWKKEWIGFGFSHDFKSRPFAFSIKKSALEIQPPKKILQVSKSNFLSWRNSAHHLLVRFQFLFFKP